MQVEQLKTREAGRAQVGLDLFLVARELKTSRGPREIFVHLQHTILFRDVFEDVVIARLQIASEFLHHIKVWICAPLADLMRKNGDVNVVQRVTIIVSKPAGRVTELAVAVADERGELSAAVDLRWIRPTRRGGIQTAIVLRVIFLGPLRQIAGIVFRLVTWREQDERWKIGRAPSELQSHYSISYAVFCL